MRGEKGERETEKKRRRRWRGIDRIAGTKPSRRARGPCLLAARPLRFCRFGLARLRVALGPLNLNIVPFSRPRAEPSRASLLAYCESNDAYAFCRPVNNCAKWQLPPASRCSTKSNVAPVRSRRDPSPANYVRAACRSATISRNAIAKYSRVKNKAHDFILISCCPLPVYVTRRPTVVQEDARPTFTLTVVIRNLRLSFSRARVHRSFRKCTDAQVATSRRIRSYLFFSLFFQNCARRGCYATIRSQDRYDQRRVSTRAEETRRERSASERSERDLGIARNSEPRPPSVGVRWQRGMRDLGSNVNSAASTGIRPLYGITLFHEIIFAAYAPHAPPLNDRAPPGYASTVNLSRR